MDLECTDTQRNKLCHASALTHLMSLDIGIP